MISDMEEMHEQNDYRKYPAAYFILSAKQTKIS